nr:palindromic element RPE4 domain-containing protein [Rickettsia tamurae]
MNTLDCFLDTVVKPRYDTECVFQSTQQRLAGMISSSFFVPCNKAAYSELVLNNCTKLYINIQCFNFLLSKFIRGFYINKFLASCFFIWSGGKYI